MRLTGEDADVMVPLIVDLDGTLIKSDLLLEGAFQLLRRNVLFLFRMLVWTTQGKAYLKEQVARHVQLDPSNIPYNRRFLSFLEQEVERGRPSLSRHSLRRPVRGDDRRALRPARKGACE